MNWKDIVPVVEIFESFQGEGPLMGRRALFVRLAGCNLVGKCKYCDTDFRVRQFMTPEQIATEINMYVDIEAWDNWVVFTGGEPMLYQDKIIDVMELVETPELVEYQVETNGTITPKSEILGWAKYIVVSPKKFKFNEVLKRYTDSLYLRKKVHFKFVVGMTPEDDIAFWRPSEVIDAVDELISYGVRKDHIWLMPFGATVKEIEENDDVVWALAKDLGVNYSDRLHVRVWKKSMMGV